MSTPPALPPRILVTGAAGNLGRWVAGACVDAGFDVVGLDRGPLPAAVRSGPVGHGTRHLVSPLEDADALAAAVSGCSAVLHCAALPGPRSADGATVLTTNTVGTYRVLEAAAAADVPRVVVAGSLSALGMAWAPQPLAPEVLPVDEAHPTRPRDPYSLSKVLDERTGAAFVDGWGLDVTVLRLPAILHPHHVVDAEDSAATGAERLVSELFGWVDVRDAAAAFLAVLRVRPAGFHLLNIAAADTRSRRQTSELLERYYPAVRTTRALTGHESLIVTDRATETLGWSATRTWRARG